MRRRFVATGGAVVVLLLAGCSDSGSPGAGPGAAEPSETPGPAAATATVPTRPPAAANAALGPTGPGTAKPCQGVAIPVGKDPQPIIDAAPAGRVVCFA